MTFRIYAPLVVVALLAACHITGPPDPAQGLGPHAKVHAPVLDEEIGDIFVEADGLWAFMTPEQARTKGFRRGQLVAFGDLDESKRHLFAVLETAQWGVRLQRLDTASVEGRTSGTLIPLAHLDLQTGLRWGFCAGEGAVKDSSCVQNAPAGTRWWLYEVTSAGLVAAGEKKDSAPSLPVALRGQVSVGPFGVDVIGDDFPQRWIAVRGSTGPRPTRPRIAVDVSCSGIGEQNLGADWTSVELTPPKDVLQVSSEAARHGADALVWCEGQQTHIAVPSLYRPGLEVSGRGFDVPPMLGTDIITVQGSVAATRVARLGAAISTGDFESAAYFADTLKGVVKDRTLDRILVDSMTAVASGGRPEAAAYHGRWATRLQWNPQNSSAWQLGMARVEAELGARKQAITRTADISELMERTGAKNRRGWMAYFYTLKEIRARGASPELLKPLNSHPELALAARAEVARDSVDELAGLRADFERRGAAALWAALSGQTAPLKCDDSSCAADVYGALWRAGSVGPEALSQVGRIGLRPGYGDKPDSAIENSIAVYPLLEPTEREAAVDSITAAALEFVRNGQCTPEKIASMRRLGVDLAFRVEGDDWTDLTAGWIASEGIEAVCSTTELLAEVGTEFAEETREVEVPASFLALHIEQKSGTQLTQTLEIAATFASQYERRDRCALWTVVLAAAHADAGGFEQAQHWVQQTTHCDVKDRSTIDLVGAYLNFQRTSSTRADYPEETRRGLRRITHSDLPRDLCAGTAPLDYEFIPALPEELRALAVRIEVPPAIRGAELSVVTANDRLINARDHLASTRELIDKREFAAAAKRLGFARDAFQAIEHEVGIARCNWLDAALFGNSAAQISNGELEFEKVGFEPIRKAGSLTEIAGTNNLAALAIELLQKSAATSAPPLGLASRDTLCAPPRNDEPRGVVIDTANGELKQLGQDDDLEVELVTPQLR